MKGLYGRFEKSLDSKNRVIVPSQLRKKLQGEDLILAAWFDRSLALFPANRFEEIAEKIHRRQMFSESARSMRRQLFGSAFSVEWDNQGRIMIPEHLMNFALLEEKDAIVMLGDYDKVEIWPRRRFKEFDEKYRVNINDAYEEMLNEVGGAEEVAASTSSEQGGEEA
jgi:MraZ protein